MAAFPLLELHGLFMDDFFFAPWREGFRSRGFAPVFHHYRGTREGRFIEPCREVTLNDFVDGVAAEIEERNGEVVLFGHSMGALVGYLASLRTPPRALIMLTPALPHPYPMRPMHASLGQIMYVAQAFSSLVTGRMVPPYRGDDSAGFTEAPAHVRRACQPKLRPMPYKVCRELAFGVRRELPPPPHPFPILVVAGARDAVVPIKSVEAFVRDRRMEYLHLPKGGHVPPYEPCGGECLGQVLEWLAERVSP